MIVLGVDPGTLATGFGVVEWRKGKLSQIHFGVVKNRSTDSMPIRLQTIYTHLVDVIERYHPDEFAIESAFYGKNVQSAMKIGHARGVSILAAVQNQIPTAEYAPREVKKAIVGNGAATKGQVAYMVRKLLNVKNEKMITDVSDALAVAICHIHRVLSPGNKQKVSSWKSFITLHPERVIS